MSSKTIKIVIVVLVCLLVGVRIYKYYSEKKETEKANNLLEAAQNALFYEKDTAKALPIYEEFLKMKPGFTPVYQDLLPVYRTKGDSAKTKEYRQKIEWLTEPYVPTV